MHRKQKRTSAAMSHDTLRVLNALKKHPRETLEDVIQRLIIKSGEAEELAARVEGNRT